MDETLPVLKDLPITEWPFPGDQDASIVRYQNPRPRFTLGNPRPSIQEAVDSGDAVLLEKVLATHAFLENGGDSGLVTRADPTCQLSIGSLNVTSTVEMWLRDKTVAELQEFPPAPHDSKREEEFGANGRQLVRRKRSATPLGHALVGYATKREVALTLLKATMLNPNLTIVFHDVENVTQPSSPAKLTPFREKRKMSLTEKAVHTTPPATSAFSIEVSPLYYCLVYGYDEAAELLLKNGSVDPRVGYFSNDPRSRLMPKRCSDLKPELKSLEEALDRMDRQKELHGVTADHIIDYDWMAVPRRGVQRDAQHQQHFSHGVGSI